MQRSPICPLSIFSDGWHLALGAFPFSLPPKYIQLFFQNLCRVSNEQIWCPTMVEYSMHIFHKDRFLANHDILIRIRKLIMCMECYHVIHRHSSDFPRSPRTALAGGFIRSKITFSLYLWCLSFSFHVKRCLRFCVLFGCFYHEDLCDIIRQLFCHLSLGLGLSLMVRFDLCSFYRNVTVGVMMWPPHIRWIRWCMMMICPITRDVHFDGWIKVGFSM